MSSPKPDLGQMIDHEQKLFLEQYPKMIHALTKEEFEQPDTKSVAEFFEKSLRYNVPLGRKRRAMFTIFIFRYYKGDLTENDFELARVAAWSIELLQGCFLVADDIVDNSITRRGQKCWCKTLGANSHAMNDVFHLEDAAFRLLEIYAKDESYYVDLIALMRKLLLVTLAGEYLDLTFACPKEVDFTHFTRKTYDRIVKYKTSYYTFYLPAAMGMTMAGVKDQAVYDEALVFLLKMGEYFQIQDDILDCFGDPDVIGKIGTDIHDNKCTWLIVTALEICTEEQKRNLKNNYGSWDEECVKKVKDIYRDLDMEGVFTRYEESAYQEMCGLIKAMDVKNLPVPIFKVFLDKLFQRKH